MNDRAAEACQIFRESITDFLEAELEGLQAETFKLHRTACDACQEFLGEIEETVSYLRLLSKESNCVQLQVEIRDVFRMWKHGRLNEPSTKVEGDGIAEVEDFFRMPREQGAMGISTSGRLERCEFGMRSLDLAFKLGAENPTKAEKIAELAVDQCLARLEERKGDSLTLWDQLAVAYAILGNARRICSDLPGALEAFGKAQQARERGSGDPGAKARIHQLRADYLAATRRFEEAIEVLEETERIYESIGDSHLQGRALICKGTVMGCAGESLRASEILQAGLRLIDPKREPRLVLAANHNLALFLLEAGKTAEAASLLSVAERLHFEIDNRIDLVRFQWLCGKILFEDRNLEAAEDAFLEVKDFFIEHEMAYDAALVSLDLALVYVQESRTRELKHLAGEMLAVFRALGIQREAIAALTFFKKAVEIEQEQLGLLHELADYLQKIRHLAEFQRRLSVSG